MTLDAYLKKQKMTEQEFASRVGVTQSYIHRIRKGQVFGLSLLVAVRIHKATDRKVGILELLPEQSR